jgi:hypothetical protein
MELDERDDRDQGLTSCARTGSRSTRTKALAARWRRRIDPELRWLDIGDLFEQMLFTVRRIGEALALRW